MAFIGNTNTTQAFTPAIDYFSGNASTTAFTLSRPVASVAQVQAVVNNVAQNPSDAFTVSGSTITFTSAPSSGTNNIYVYYTSPITQVIAPGQGTVGTTQLQNGLTVNFADGSAAAPSITNDGDTNTGIFFPAADTIAFAEGGAEIARFDSSGNLGIGTSSPSSPLNVVSATSSLAIAVNGRSSDNLGAMYFYANNGSTQHSTITASATEFRLSSVPAAAVQTFYTNGAERMRLTSDGNLQFNSGYGSVATAYGCRAWVNFNGTGTVAIRASGNVTSITDNGTGSYAVNFTTAMPDANYSISAISSTTTGNGASITTVRESGIGGSNPSTTSFQLSVRAPSFADLDVPYVYAQVFR